jgi:hypothetical protein
VALAVYFIPWPPAFKSLANFFNVFLFNLASVRASLVGVVALPHPYLQRHGLVAVRRVRVGLLQWSQASCIRHVDSLILTLVLFKVVLAVAIVLSLGGPYLREKWLTLKRRRSVPVHLRSSATVRVKSSGQTRAVRLEAHLVNWSRVFRVTFTVLFLAYPGVSVTVLQHFHCVFVGGRHWLAADMSLECYTPRWTRLAAYCGVMVVVYVVGLPLVSFALLWRHRTLLFGSSSGARAVQRRLGFLYEGYGQSAWLWEVEEQVRKLLLAAMAVLLDAGSPM